MQKIKENKVEPPKEPTDILPVYAVLIIGIICLCLVDYTLVSELSIQNKVLIVGVIVLLMISHGLQKSRMNKACNEVIAKLN